MVSKPYMRSYNELVSDLVRIPASVFPRDSDGFLSRQCPACGERFKLKVKLDDESIGHELTDEETLSEAAEMRRYCPLCLQLVEGNNWWTPEQIHYAKEAIGFVVAVKFQEMLRRTADQSGGFLQYSGGDRPIEPNPPEEQEGMMIVAPPCHENAVAKVPEGWSNEVACYECGVRYPVDLLGA